MPRKNFRVVKDSDICHYLGEILSSRVLAAVSEVADLKRIMHDDILT
jgi:hypothetical protein